MQTENHSGHDPGPGLLQHLNFAVVPEPMHKASKARPVTAHGINETVKRTRRHPQAE
jgi:hypothetical protein